MSRKDFRQQSGPDMALLTAALAADAQSRHVIDVLKRAAANGFPASQGRDRTSVPKHQL